MAPWLITVSRWPLLTAYVAEGMARVVGDPVIVGAVAAGGALALTSALLLLLGRARRPRPHSRST